MVTVWVAASYFIESLTLPSGPLIRLLSAAHKASNWRVPSIPNLKKKRIMKASEENRNVKRKEGGREEKKKGRKVGGKERKKEGRRKGRNEIRK